MALANLTGTAGIQPGSIEGLKGPQNPAGGRVGSGAISGEDFRRTLDQVSGALGGQPMAKPSAAGAGSLEKLKFSNHAIERMRSRGISFAPETMKNIENGVAKAAAKGSKDTLVLAGDSALVVSVKNNTVVTVMDRQAMKDNVFTNIDSTVIV